MVKKNLIEGRIRKNKKPSQIIAVDVVQHITLNCFITQNFSILNIVDGRSTAALGFFIHVFDIYLRQDVDFCCLLFSAVMKMTPEQIDTMNSSHSTIIEGMDEMRVDKNEELM